MTSLGPAAGVLGRLLVGLQALDALPEVENMAEFLRLTLGEVPGVANAFICLDGQILPGQAAATVSLDLPCPRSADGRCHAPDRPGIHIIAMRTPRREFGCLVLMVDDEAELRVYEPFVTNVGHMVATILENRENARSSVAANLELNRMVRELERRVQGRTKELAAAEERYRATLATLPDAVSALRAVRGESGAIVDFVWTYVNSAEAAQHPDEDLVGSRLLDVHPEYRKLGLFDAFCRAVATGEQQILEVQRADDDAEQAFAECRTSRLGDGVVAAFRDITDRIVAARMLARSEERYRLLTENASDVVMLLTPQWRFEWVSASVTDVLGWGQEAVVGHLIDEFIHSEDLARFRQIVADARGNAASAEIRIHCADGSYQWVACRTRAKMDDHGNTVAVVGAMVDIKDRKAAEAELHFSASHDPLTGLANRSELVLEAERALAGGRRSGRTTALLMLDLDHFKNVNDTLGHGVGDELLGTVAKRISAVVRSTDLVGRFGGDEFVVLMRALDHPADGLRLAERLVGACREPVTIGGIELYATASVGIAEAIPGAGPVRTAVDLIREADTAMYAAKVGGRDRATQFNDDLRRIVDDRMRLESDLRHALARDELAVWYQPEIDLHDGTVRAAEALVRWHHPDGLVRAADQFIEAAEESGLILDIGAWVLTRACADAARWSSHDPDRRVVLRVNLSGLQLGESDLVGTLDGALAASGIDPRLLCVEITETTVLSDNAVVRANLDGIRQRGVELAIDDFGTGYGSLTYLRRYPIDVMKIDRSFVTKIATDDNDRNLVAGVVALADRLGISVTAEGVETAEQAALLSTLGCAGAQGFLYAPALPLDAWTDFLRSHYSAEPVQT